MKDATVLGLAGIAGTAVAGIGAPIISACGVQKLGRAAKASRFVAGSHLRSPHAVLIHGKGLLGALPTVATPSIGASGRRPVDLNLPETELAAPSYGLVWTASNRVTGSVLASRRRRPVVDARPSGARLAPVRRSYSAWNRAKQILNGQTHGVFVFALPM
jgi:hypothetical protein